MRPATGIGAPLVATCCSSPCTMSAKRHSPTVAFAGTAISMRNFMRPLAGKVAALRSIDTQGRQELAVNVSMIDTVPLACSAQSAVANR